MTQGKRKRKSSGGLIASLLQKLGEEDIKRWEHLCRYNATYGQLRDFLEKKFPGEKIATKQVEYWWHSNKPRGEDAIALMAMGESWQNLEPNNLLFMAAGMCMKLAQTLKDSVIVQAASPNSQLDNYIEALREVRQCATEINNLTTQKNQMEMYEAGILELRKKIEKTFEGTQIEEAIFEALEDATNDLIREAK